MWTLLKCKKIQIINFNLMKKKLNFSINDLLGYITKKPMFPMVVQSCCPAMVMALLIYDHWRHVNCGRLCKSSPS